jgi:hypothetical protein
MRVKTIFATLCATLLSMGFALSASAGTVNDLDGDLVPDAFDNCSNVPNGSTTACYQTDADNDGFGNVCDADFDQNNVVTVTDFNTLLGVFGQNAPVQDLDCSGAITVTDFNLLLQLFGTAPGPGAL